MTDVTVCLFGAPRIERNGVGVAVERRKALALLAYLVATRQPHGRDALATLLWPEFDQQRARAALRRTLVALNAALGDGCIEASGDRLALAGAPNLAVDLERFNDLLAKAALHEHRPFRLCDDCLTSLTQAVDLYRSDFLAGFTLKDAAEFDDWQAYQSGELRRRLEGALEKLALGHAGRREYDLALRHARRWLALDPLSEPAHRLIMRLHAWAGDRAAAARQYEECVSVLAEELGIEPEPETRALHEELLQPGKEGERELGDEGEQVCAPPTSVPELPPDPTPFLGREVELAQIAERLADPACRLLTIIGPGGIGKTRLALRASRIHADRFTDGACFVDLVSINSPASVPAAILDALQAAVHGRADPERQLLGYLRGKHLLLVLDNFEHLMDCAQLLPKTLRAAPQVKLLVTSRARLNLRDEWLLPLGGLELPPPSLDAPVSTLTPDPEAYSATALFLQTVRRLQPDYRPTSGDASQIVHICCLLEGMPLGIELAAAWARTLSLREIAGELERGLDLLTTSLRDVPARHRSMAAAFDHSWRLLSPREQGILRQLSVFRNGFMREAAGAVAGANLADLTGLADASWLRFGLDGRYEMHEAVRQYCEAKLAGEDASLVRDRHCHYYVSFTQTRESGLLNSPEAVQEVTAEVDNLLVAWNWAVGQGDVARITSLVAGLDSCGSLVYPRFGAILEAFENARQKLRHVLLATCKDRDGRREIVVCLARILACEGLFWRSPDATRRAEALAQEGLALLSEFAGNAQEGLYVDEWKQAHAALTVTLASTILARGDRTRALGLCQDLLSDTSLDSVAPSTWSGRMVRLCLSVAYKCLAYCLMDIGRYKESQQYIEYAIAQFERDGADALVANARLHVADLAYVGGDYDRAEALARDLLRPGGESSYLQGADRGWAWMWLGRLEAIASRHPQARAYCRRGVALCREYGDMMGLAQALQELGAVELAAGNIAEAQRLYLESLEVFRPTEQAGSLTRPASLVGLGRVALARRDLAAARAQFRQVLESRECRAWETADAILGMAQAIAAEGQPERAIELIAFAEGWPPTMHVARERARELLRELASQVPPEAFAAATARGQSRQVEELVAELSGRRGHGGVRENRIAS
jgi:predicted ATPase/DNA-binding SARP family transcriptional activator